jgi:hypothetical protein
MPVIAPYRGRANHQFTLVVLIVQKIIEGEIIYE